MIEVTTRCNYNCIYCFRRNLSINDIGDMSPDLYYRIINEAAEAGATKVVFSGWGEPLLHPKILDFISYAKSKGMSVLLNTNGYFLIEYIDVLHELGVDNIAVSIDAASHDTYELIRRGGDLPRIIKALLKLKRLRIKSMSPPTLHIHFTLNKYNYRNILSTLKLAKEVGASRVIISNVIPMSSEIEESLACYRDSNCVKEVSKLLIDIARISLWYGVDVSLPKFSSSYSERSCPFVSEQALYIRFDGLITPCIYYAHHWKVTLNNIERVIEPVILGDLNREGLLGIWMKPEYVRFRVITYFMHMPSCLDCPLQEYCTLTLSNKYDCWGGTHRHVLTARTQEIW